MIRKLLKRDPRNRPTTEEILSVPFIKNLMFEREKVQSQFPDSSTGSEPPGWQMVRVHSAKDLQSLSNEDKPLHKSDYVVRFFFSFRSVLFVQPYRSLGEDTVNPNQQRFHS